MQVIHWIDRHRVPADLVFVYHQAAFFLTVVVAAAARSGLAPKSWMTLLSASLFA